jgi:hypothetical protein
MNEAALVLPFYHYSLFVVRRSFTLTYTHLSLFYIHVLPGSDDCRAARGLYSRLRGKSLNLGI